MHEIFTVNILLERLPLHIESISSNGDTLFVGTREGHLLIYNVVFCSVTQCFQANLEKTTKSFSKKPITQIQVIPEYHILLSLSDNIVSVHDLTVFTKVVTVENTRGATSFSVDLKKLCNTTGDFEYSLRICVAVRRRVQFYYWKNRNFHELYEERELRDIVRYISWCDNRVCAGTKTEYYLIDGETKSIIEIFSNGNQQDALLTKISLSQMAITKEDTTFLFNHEGKPTNNIIKWSEMPQNIVHLHPYYVAALSKYIEIQTIEPRVLIQSIDLFRPKFLCISGNSIFIASNSCVWKLCQAPINHQIDELMKAKEYELALELTNVIDDREDKTKRIHKLKNLYAFHLFVQGNFEKALNIFSKLDTDPSQVIGLFPNLLPNAYRKELRYPGPVPELEGAELERGIFALNNYLTEKRRELPNLGKKVHTTPIIEGNPVIVTKKQLAQIIDTTLLKCYLQTNEALIAPLLRLKDNQCHIDESEKILKNNHKYFELILLYESNGKHKKALEFLLGEARKPNSILFGHEHTISYLQRLGAKHLDLIFDYACWVLKFRPDDSLRIFTEDTQEVESLPRDKVVRYLEKTCKQLVIPYLEHVIREWGDETTELHNMLALYYKDKLQPLMDNYLQNLPIGQRQARAGEETNELGEIRSRLNFFLETSTYYSPERLLAHFPLNCFFRERATLLGQLGRHEQALAVYVHVLQDNKMAEDHCQRTYNRMKDANKDVYIHLLNIYLSPPDEKILGVMASYKTVDKSNVNIQAALDLLKKHAKKINTAKALELLPPSTNISEIKEFLINVLEHQAVYKRRCQLLKSLHYSEFLQVHKERILAESVRINVGDDLCQVCNRKIGTAAFAHKSDGVLIHYGCCEK